MRIAGRIATLPTWRSALRTVTPALGPTGCGCHGLSPPHSRCRRDSAKPLPRAQHSENIFDRIRAVATHRNLNVHDISVRTLLDNVEQHIELDERMTLKDAHDEVTELEAEMRRDVPEIAKILTHIESEPATIERPEELVGDAELEHRLKTVAAQFPEILDVHDFIFKRVRGRLYVSCHCTLSDNLSLARAMLHSDQLEFVSSRTRRSCFACLSIPNQHR